MILSTINYFRNIIFFLLFIGTVNICYPQSTTSYRIKYHVSYQRDVNDPSRIEETAILMTQGTSSFFAIENHLKRDSVTYFGAKQEDRIPITFNKYYIVKDFEEEKIIHTENFVTHLDFYRYDTAMVTLESWRISSDTLTIAGAVCQRADIEFGGRQWIAWFNPDLPIYDGPYKFYGLPGLIYQVHDKNRSWVFELIGIEQDDSQSSYDLSYLPKVQLQTRDEFYKTKKYQLDNSFYLLENAGKFSLKRADDPGNMQRDRDYKEFREKDNNWIELYPKN